MSKRDDRPKLVVASTRGPHHMLPIRSSGLSNDVPTKIEWQYSLHFWEDIRIFVQKGIDNNIKLSHPCVLTRN